MSLRTNNNPVREVNFNFKKPVSICYNSSYWKVNQYIERDYNVSFLGTLKVSQIFNLNKVISKFHIIGFDWSEYQNGNLINKYLEWARNGKYRFITALFYTVETPTYKEDRVISVALTNESDYLVTKEGLLATYVDWSFTGKLPITNLLSEF